MSESKVHGEPGQRAVTRACAQAALLLMQHGSESALVENTAKRIGIAAGADSVEIALLSNAIVVSTLVDGHCITTVRRMADRGINMTMAVEVQRIMLDMEKKRMDIAEVERQLTALRPSHYNRWLVVGMVGISCSAFAFLAGADFPALWITFAASVCAMVVRQQLAFWHFNPLINFSVTAFLATSIAVQLLNFPPGTKTPHIALASCLLMLVPGMPLINSLADMVKGYVNTGIARLGFALLLCLGVCLGTAFALRVWNVRGWF
ncbi:MAG: threonine/serine exporter family protein [Chthoniobacterales bacterium]|nr:threonine/serine exporter family protein [Chthoniobacterales bacterium]